MTRYVDPNQTIERLRAEAHTADQVIEDYARALEDSERVAERYREALVHIDQLEIGAPVGRKVNKIIEDAVWTKTKEAS